MRWMNVTVFVLALTLTACGGSSHEQPAAKPTGGSGGGGNNGGLDGQAPLDFTRIKAEIFTPHCVRCHGKFEVYANVALELSQIQDAVLNNRMPRRGPLSDELKALLTEWINLGAPEVASGG